MSSIGSVTKHVVLSPHGIKRTMWSAKQLNPDVRLRLEPLYSPGLHEELLQMIRSLIFDAFLKKREKLVSDGVYDSEGVYLTVEHYFAKRRRWIRAGTESWVWVCFHFRETGGCAASIPAWAVRVDVPDVQGACYVSISEARRVDEVATMFPRSQEQSTT